MKPKQSLGMCPLKANPEKRTWAQAVHLGGETGKREETVGVSMC